MVFSRHPFLQKCADCQWYRHHAQHGATEVERQYAREQLAAHNSFQLLQRRIQTVSRQVAASTFPDVEGYSTQDGASGHHYVRRRGCGALLGGARACRKAGGGIGGAAEVLPHEGDHTRQNKALNGAQTSPLKACERLRAGPPD